LGDDHGRRDERGNDKRAHHEGPRYDERPMVDEGARVSDDKHRTAPRRDDAAATPRVSGPGENGEECSQDEGERKTSAHHGEPPSDV
jgi:hypothetical protein